MTIYKVHTMSDEINKSNYGPAGTAAAAQYQPHANQERKARNVDQVQGIGQNKNVKAYSSKPGQLSAKQQAAKEMSSHRVKALSGPVKTLSSEEIERIKSNITPITQIKKDELVEVEADGKQEIVDGKEPLKKDPKNRWKSLKKALSHEKAFMNLEEAMGDDEDEAEPQPEQPPEGQQADPTQDLQEELAPNEQEAEQPAEQPDPTSGAGTEGELEAVSASPEDEQTQPEESEDSQEDGESSPVDPQELMEALKDEGYSDQEISYIVHGHHAPEVDPTKQAKAQATSAMSDLDLENARAMAEMERKHTEESMSHEREHKRRMSDLEYEQAQKKHSLVDQDTAHKQRMSDLEYQQASSSNPANQEQTHKQRMLDLEYEKAKKEVDAGDSAGDAEVNKQMKQLEVEKKKLELQLRKEEMKLELEFKKREHELKLKLMEQQIKEQAKQKSEISGVKHKQKLAETKNPPAEPGKKPLKKSEEDDE